MAEEHGLHTVQTGFRSAVKPQFCEPLEHLFRDLSRQATVSRTRASNQVALLAELLYELYENRLARQRNPCSEPLKPWPAIPDGFSPELTTRALSWQALWEAAWQRGEPMPDVSQHGVLGCGSWRRLDRLYYAALAFSCSGDPLPK